MNQVSIHKDDLIAIKEFTDKYTAEYITIMVDSSSGIGSIVSVSLNAVVNGDMVTISKNIVDESSW
jgi:hypothetical protein